MSTLNEGDRNAGAFDQAGVIGRGTVRCAPVRLDKDIFAEPLRRLHGSQRGPVDRCAASVGSELPQRVNHRDRWYDDRRTAAQGVDDSRHHLGWHQRAGRVVYHDELDRASHCRKSVPNRTLAGVAACHHPNGHGAVGQFFANEVELVGRGGDHDLVDGTGQRVHRANQQ